MSGLLLWVIGLVISSIAWQSKSDAIENISCLFGNFGAKLVSIVSIVAFSFWFIARLREIPSVVIPLDLARQTPTHATLFYVFLGVFVGAAVMLLARRNIVNTIKHISVVAAILLSIIFISLLFVSDVSIHTRHFDVSIYIHKYSTFWTCYSMLCIVCS